MSTDQLIPRLPRRMKQPRKDTLRQTIRNRDAEVYRLKAEIERLRTPWWRKVSVFSRRLRSTDKTTGESTP